MVNINQMLKYTPAKIKKETSKTVKSVKLIKAVFDSDEYGFHQRANFKVKATSKPRQVTIKIYGDQAFSKGKRKTKTSIFERPAWVHCSCEWFTFFCEVALANRRSSDIINSNGKPPVETNPRQWPYVCKHIIAAIDKLKTIKFTKPKVKPSKEDIEFLMEEIEKYIPGR